MDIIISLIALFISILSFVLSFLQSHDVKMTVNKIEIKNLNDSFALLFDDNNKIKIGLVNYNDRDVLLYLKEGYVEIDKRQHLIKPAYYTANRNSIINSWMHLSAIESKLAISISPSMLNELPCEEQRDIDELYLLLCDKKVVRSNAKLISIDSSEEPINLEKTPLSIGQKIALTFLHNVEFKFLGQTVILYTANLLINAFVKDIQKNDDGTLKILYGDTDSKPMYISFSAFETIEEAKQELDAISQRIGIYTNAQTSNTYINQYYEEKR